MTIVGTVPDTDEKKVATLDSIVTTAELIAALPQKSR